MLGRDQAEQQNVVSLAADVRRLYFQDYQRQWDALLADIDFVPITSVAQAADVLRVISGPTSPLKKLLVAVAKETDLQQDCLLYTSPSPRDRQKSRMPSSA